MVRILSNGEIVPDDDPRAQRQQSTTNRNTSSSSASRPSPAGYGYGDHPQQHQGNAVSPFTALNEKLLSFGIPRWSVGGLTIEPIVSVALVLSVLFFGLPGILLVVVLFAVSQLSLEGGGDWMNRLRNSFTGGGGNPNRGANSGPSSSSGRPTSDNDGNRRRFGGGGHRLGD